MPKRIQRKRTKGYKHPEGCIYVGRRTKWGNPFKIIGDQIYCYSTKRHVFDPWIVYDERIPATKEMLISLYRAWITRRIIKDFLPIAPTQDLHELKGKDLSCFCPLDSLCHADVLIELANEV